MQTFTYNPAFGMILMSACVYATTYAKKNNCIVSMLWGDTYYTCNGNNTAKQFHDNIIFNLTR